MCRSAASELEAMGYEAETVHLADDIGHCRDCGLCADGQCVLDDAMTGIYASFSEADLLVLATPVHFSGPSSIMKAAIDRFQPYWFSRDAPHPSAALGLVCAGSESPEFRPIGMVLRAFSAMLGMRWLGCLEFPDTDRRGSEGADEEVRGFIRSVLAGRSGRSCG